MFGRLQAKLGPKTLPKVSGLCGFAGIRVEGLPAFPRKVQYAFFNGYIEFGAMDVTKPYEFIGFGAMDVTKPYEFIGFGAFDVPVGLISIEIGSVQS